VDALERRSRSVARIVALHGDDGSFDRAFWASIVPARRLELLWEMTLEYCAWQGDDAGQSRLQRSVCRVERRGS
jgi:hypothetical protein